MDGVFQRLARASRAVVESVHGDAVKVVPLVRLGGVNAKAEPDLASAFETVACFFENTLSETDATLRPLTGQGRMLHASPAITASIREVEGRELSSETVLVRLRDGQAFQISSSRPDGVGTILATLNRVQPIAEST
ncbi:hypothetical protein [Mycoplana ramosa]|uniref:Uncharacterized protein n=1 Tax=Mycoplana ramosa TaxID=40837 RepID=A0ABW3YWJ3_MYCRA